MNIENIIVGLVKRAIDFGVTHAAGLDPIAYDIMGIAVIFKLLWESLRLATGAADYGDFGAELLELVIAVAIATGLLVIYRNFVVGIWGLQDQIVSAINTPIPGSPLPAAEDALVQFTSICDQIAIRAMQAAWESFSVKETVMDAAKSPLAAVATLLSAPQSIILVSVLLAAVFVVAQIAKVMVMTSYAMGGVAFGIAVALGPLFIATLPTALSDYFWNWLKFLLQAMLAIVVAVLLVKLMSEALNSVQVNIGGYADSSTAFGLPFPKNPLLKPILVSGAALTIMGVIAYLLGQVQEITASLFSGSFGGVKSGLGAAGRAAMGALKTAASRRIREATSGRESSGGSAAGASATGAPAGAATVRSSTPTNPGLGASVGGNVSMARGGTKEVLELAHKRAGGDLSVRRLTDETRKAAGELGRISPDGGLLGAGKKGAAMPFGAVGKELAKDAARSQLTRAATPTARAKVMNDYTEQLLGDKPRTLAAVTDAARRAAKDLGAYGSDGRLITGQDSPDDAARAYLEERRTRMQTPGGHVSTDQGASPKGMTARSSKVDDPLDPPVVQRAVDPSNQAPADAGDSGVGLSAREQVAPSTMGPTALRHQAEGGVPSWQQAFARDAAARMHGDGREAALSSVQQLAAERGLLNKSRVLAPDGSGANSVGVLAQRAMSHYRGTLSVSPTASSRNRTRSESSGTAPPGNPPSEPKA